MKVLCPHCADKLIISDGAYADSGKQIYAICFNPECGWTGKLNAGVAWSKFKNKPAESPPGLSDRALA